MDRLVQNRLLAYFGIILSVPIILVFSAAWLEAYISTTWREIELITITLATVVGAMALVRYYAEAKDIFLCLGVGFLGTAILTGFSRYLEANAEQFLEWHLIVGVMEFSWVAPRLWLELMLCLAIYVWYRGTKTDKQNFLNHRWMYAGSVVFILIAAVAYSVGLEMSDHAHTDTHQEMLALTEHGSALDLPLAFLAPFIAIMFFARGAWDKDNFEHFMMCGVVLVGVLQMTFFVMKSFGWFHEISVNALYEVPFYSLVMVGLLYSFADLYRHAEQVNRAKRDFLATMSHEIRTPLNGVLGMAQLLKDTSLNKDQHKMVATISSSGEALMAILNDVLDMSKIEAGQIELEETSFHLGDLLSSTTTGLQSLAIDKGIGFESQFTHVADLSMRGDPVRLRQILWNLLTNAIKFTHEGRVSLTALRHSNFPEAAKHLHRKDREVIRFIVSDSGIGMSKDQLQKIFDPFQQADTSTTRKYGGSGLGLSIVSKLVEKIGGHIEASSQKGIGTQFDIWLPFEILPEGAQEQADTAEVNDETAIMTNLPVLLAEDNQVNAMVATAFLKKQNLEVVWVKNGLEAVEAVKEQEFGLVFMDVHMPEMDGMDATKNIRQAEKASGIEQGLPIIGLTAEAFVEKHKELMRHGMNRVITKPLEEKQLLKVLHHFLSRIGSDPQKVQVDIVQQKSAEQAPNYIDFQQLEVLEDTLGVEQVKLIMQTAVIDLRRHCEALANAVDSQDEKAIKTHAHILKGLASNLFADPLRLACEKVEEAVREDQDCVEPIKYLGEVVELTLDTLAKLRKAA